jgi:hypothetical protein
MAIVWLSIGGAVVLWNERVLGLAEELDEAELGEGHVAEDDDSDTAHERKTVDGFCADDDEDVEQSGEGSHGEGECKGRNFASGGENYSFENESGGKDSDAEIGPEDDALKVGDGVALSVSDGIVLLELGWGVDVLQGVGEDEEDEDAEADGDPGFGESDGGGGEVDFGGGGGCGRLRDLGGRGRGLGFAGFRELGEF